MKKPFFKKIQLFDCLFVSVFLLIVAAFFIFLFRKSDYLNVRLKITDKNILYAYSSPQSWFVYLFKKGMVGKDSLGRVNAEIIDVYYYDTSPSTKAVYLAIKLRTAYTSRSQEYRFKGTPVAIGEGLRINFGKILAEGLIVGIEGLENPYEQVDLKVKTRLMDNSPNFLETTGVELFVAEAIRIGDKIFDSSGKIMAEIIDKKVLPAQKNTFDDRGNVYQSLDPRKKDVFLTLKVKAKKINNEYYFFDDLRIKVNENLPLHFKNLSVYPVIIEIFND